MLYFNFSDGTFYVSLLSHFVIFYLFIHINVDILTTTRLLKWHLWLFGVDRQLCRPVVSVVLVTLKNWTFSVKMASALLD